MSFTGHPLWWKLLSRSFLAVEQGCTCFTAPLHRLKRLYGSFPDIKRFAQASQCFQSGFIGLSCLLNRLCTSFTGPPQWWKLLSNSFLLLKQAWTSFTGLPQRWKLLSRSSLAHKQAGTCFTAPPRRLKGLCQAFPAHKQACTRFIGRPQWWKLLSRLHELHRSSTVVKTAFSILSWHLNRTARASQHLLGG